MNTRTTTIPKPFHDAVLKWRDTFLPDYPFLIENWDKHFPKDPRFELCAYRELGMCSTIECGDHTGKPKYQRAKDMPEETAHTLFGAIRAQASTEFGSIQQHRLTLARAQEEEEQVWILRMMAEELRHGYQMLHVLTDDPDWEGIAGQSSADMIEEILSMQTGSHVLGAFNVDFDSFVDNFVFCALIDRVGKYQLQMQKISSYQPMAESMPQMLREEAFHLAAGVVPMRRWAAKAAAGDVSITMQMMQKAVNKWLPRGLEMFGDERGGGSNVKAGLKPMKNAEAQKQYYAEVAKVLHDVNHRFVRARLPHLDHAGAEALIRQLEAEGGSVQGIAHDDLLHMPHPDYFRRRGVAAFRMVGADGTQYADAQAYAQHLARTLPESYLASRDFKDFIDTLREVASGQTTADAAARRMPVLRRVGGSCPCSKSVRWVVDEPLPTPAPALAPTSA
jgi:1,2-phenylacetyl-CoA epoxidase catalytic subunit